MHSESDLAGATPHRFSKTDRNSAVLTAWLRPQTLKSLDAGQGVWTFI